MIQNALSSDPDEHVRAAAAGLLSDARRTGGLDTLSAAAKGDGSEIVRLTAVKAIGELMDTSPNGRSVLEQAAQHDASKEVRDAAARLLRVETPPELTSAETAHPQEISGQQ